MLFSAAFLRKTYPKGVTTMPRAKKATAAAAEVKEVKEEVKTEAAAVEEAVEAPAKKPAKKAPAKKAAAKAEKAEVKEEVKAEAKAEAKAEVFIEFGGVQVAVDDIVKNAKLTVGDDKDVKIYVKPEESKAYIVAGEESVAMDVYFC